jgi:hypothetical protein
MPEEPVKTTTECYFEFYTLSIDRANILKKELEKAIKNVVHEHGDTIRDIQWKIRQ